MAAAVTVHGHDERGFSLVEAVVALGVLAVGLLMLAQVFTLGLGLLASAGPDIIAREKATEAVESVFTARDTRTITWTQIRNREGESGSDNGVFLDGQQGLKTPGADGLVNTPDDGAVEALVQPGPDGQLGTSDDLTVPLTQFTREIEIRDVNANLRRVRVIIRYQAGRFRREYKLETFISSFA
jgi:hypothetical protein